MSSHDILQDEKDNLPYYQVFSKIDADREQFGVYAPDPEELSNDILEKLEQAGRVPSKDKFRRMACNTFIYTGACPYNDRCVFLHDYRIRAEGVKAKATRQTKVSNLIKDTFYWPDMSHREVISHLDSQGLADVNQRYQIPDCFGKANANIHNRSIYSLWAHFVAFCMYNRALKPNVYNNLQFEKYFQDSESRENRFIKGLKRLPVLYELSNAEHLEDHNTALLSAEYDAIASGLDTLHTPVRGYEPPKIRGKDRLEEGYDTPLGVRPSLGLPHLTKTEPAPYMRDSRESIQPAGLLSLPQDMRQAASTSFMGERPELLLSSSDSTVSWLHRPLPVSDPFSPLLSLESQARQDQVSRPVQVISPTTAARNQELWMSLIDEVKVGGTEENEEEDCEFTDPASDAFDSSRGDGQWEPVNHSVGVRGLELERTHEGEANLPERQLSTLSTFTDRSLSPAPVGRHLIGSSISVEPSRVAHAPSWDSLGNRLDKPMTGAQHKLNDWFVSYDAEDLGTRTRLPPLNENSSHGGVYSSYSQDMVLPQARTASINQLQPTVHQRQKVATMPRMSASQTQPRDSQYHEWSRQNSHYPSANHGLGHSLHNQDGSWSLAQGSRCPASPGYANRHYNSTVAAGPSSAPARLSPFSPQQRYQVRTAPSFDLSYASGAAGAMRVAPPGSYHIQPPSPVPSASVQVGRYIVELPQATYRDIDNRGVDTSQSGRPFVASLPNAREGSYVIQPPSPSATRWQSPDRRAKASYHGSYQRQSAR